MMTNILKSLLFLSALVSAAVTKANTTDCTKVYPVSTEKTTLVYTVGEDNRLIFRYYGARIYDTDQFRQIKGYLRPDCKQPKQTFGYFN